MSIEPERMIKLRLADGKFLWLAERRWRMYLKRLEERKHASVRD